MLLKGWARFWVSQSNPSNYCAISCFLCCGFILCWIPVFWKTFYPLWSLMFFSVLALVCQHNKLNLGLPALLGLYNFWVLQFFGRALDFHTRIWSRIEISNSVQKLPRECYLCIVCLIVPGVCSNIYAL